jgi:3-oxoacyl-[acyl-carrier-protein] synthase II
MRITGIGLITPLGATAPQTWSALLAGEHIRYHARAAGVDATHDRIHTMAQRAAAEALAQARWTERAADAARTALVVGTSKGPIETWLCPPVALSDVGNRSGSVVGIRDSALGLSSIASALRQKFPICDGSSVTISAACASGLHALIRAAVMLKSGEADRVLVVAAEASVHPLFLGSFKRLGVLPREETGCRPFDQNREGFLMSESAAAVCLELPESEAAAVVRLERFALGGDATHMTGGDPRGATLRRLLLDVMRGEPVDLIHAHGTGTEFNDPLELAAFDDHCVIHNRVPRVYSHKGALGHSLGAAGLVSVALNCMIHTQGIVPPNVRTTQPLPTRRLRIAREAERTPIQRSLAIAAGFGGPTAAVSLASP